MTRDLVSIVTPAYKAAAYVSETIRSVQAQTHDAWEMLIVEDGSPDDTWKVVETHAAADPRVKLIRQANAGPAMARQKALDHATGRYIAFLDSDDLWLPEKLERQIAFMQARSSAFSFTAFRRITADGGSTGRLIAVPSEMSYRRLLGNTAIATSTVLIDREKTGPLRMTKTYYDDFVLWLGLSRRPPAAELDYWECESGHPILAAAGAQLGPRRCDRGCPEARRVAVVRLAPPVEVGEIPEGAAAAAGLAAAVREREALRRRFPTLEPRGPAGTGPA